MTVFVVCAESNEEAERIASSMELNWIMSEQGMESIGTPSPEKAAQYSYNRFELARLEENKKRMLVGNPKKIKEELYRISELYGTDEIMLVTITYDFKDKIKSFELIAREIL